jgi:hypothetical protein
MPSIGRIGVGDFFDQDKLRPALPDRVEVHFLEPASFFVFDSLARDDFEAVEQRLRLLAAVRLDDPHDKVDTLTALGPCGPQHLVCLANARRSAKKNLQMTARLLARLVQQRLRERDGGQVRCDRPSGVLCNCRAMERMRGSALDASTSSR